MRLVLLLVSLLALHVVAERDDPTERVKPVERKLRPIHRYVLPASTSNESHEERRREKREKLTRLFRDDDDAEYDGGLARIFGITGKTFEDDRDLMNEALEDEFRKMPKLVSHKDDSVSYLDTDVESEEDRSKF